MTGFNEKTVLSRKHMVDILLGGKDGADIILKNGKVVNVITAEIYEADISIAGERILLVGDCSPLAGKNTIQIDMRGKYLMPGFIDSHMHFESSMLTATEFTRLSLVSGTTCLVADPHEIGNVLGKTGIYEMCREAAQLPNHIRMKVPALCPDSPGVETSGAVIQSDDMEELLSYPAVAGIGETQGITSVTGVYKHHPEIFTDTIISTAYARSRHMTVDGNAPSLYGKELAAHIIAGGGDVSCHETSEKKEIIEKLRQGMYVLVREGSTGKNMSELIRAYTEEHLDFRRAILATDDMLASDLKEYGHMNDVLRRTMKAGMPPAVAIQMATINAAVWQENSEIGALAPGKYADIAVVEGALEDMNVSMVFLKGQKVAENGKLLIDLPHYQYPDRTKNTVHCRQIKKEDIILHTEKRGSVSVRCIGLIEDQADHTHALKERMQAADGYIQPDRKHDILPISVICRHGKNRIGNAFAKGFQLKEGAIAQTVSHDCHNIVTIGADYDDMVLAVNRLIAMQGGVVLTKRGKILGELELNIGGLITDRYTGEEVAEKMDILTSLAKEECGCDIHAPFMHLGFMALSTAPAYRITDMGLLDVEACEIIEVIENERKQWW